MRMSVAVGALVVFTLGCSGGQGTPVRLQGDPVSIASLAGTWSGEYTGEGTRGGSLGFALRAGSDTLFGDVTMMDPMGQPIRGMDTPEAHRAHVQSPQQLRIDFVAVQSDSVRGTLEPYMSPDCQCATTTTFYGRVAGDRISGTFQARSGGRVRGGTWEVRRTGGAR